MFEAQSFRGMFSTASGHLTLAIFGEVNSIVFALGWQHLKIIRVIVVSPLVLVVHYFARLQTTPDL